MQDINELINETDTDNVILNKLKELGTKLTGQENVQGETISDVLEFINSNYSGGGSGNKTVLYLNMAENTKYAYKDENYTIKTDMNELYNACENGCVFVMGTGKYLPYAYGKDIDVETGKEHTIVFIFDDAPLVVYSS